VKRMPEKGIAKEEVLSRLQSMKKDDAKYRDARMFGLIYNAGEDVEEMARRLTRPICSKTR